MRGLTSEELCLTCGGGKRRHLANGGKLSRDHGLTRGQSHLLKEGIFQRQVISSVDQQLILEVLGWVKVFAWWFLSITPSLNAVVASSDTSILHLHICRRMSKLALGVRTGAFVTLELPAHLQLQPTRVLAIEERVHVYHGHPRGGERKGRGGDGIRRN